MLAVTAQHEQLIIELQDLVSLVERLGGMRAIPIGPGIFMNTTVYSESVT